MATIEYFYAAHSAFAYLGSARLTTIAEQGGHRIEHRPMDLRTVVPAAGSIPTTERSGKHRSYFFGREIQRWSEERQAPVVAGMPTYHHHDIGLPNRFLIAGIAGGLNIDDLAHTRLEVHWRYDADLADPGTLKTLAAQVGCDGLALLDSADSNTVHTSYENNTKEAVERSVFGSPTYFVDGDMFYGQDRLEMVERALAHPYR